MIEFDNEILYIQNVKAEAIDENRKILHYLRRRKNDKNKPTVRVDGALHNVSSSLARQQYLGGNLSQLAEK